MLVQAQHSVCRPHDEHITWGHYGHADKKDWQKTSEKRFPFEYTSWSWSLLQKWKHYDSIPHHQPRHKYRSLLVFTTSLISVESANLRNLWWLFRAQKRRWVILKQLLTHQRLIFVNGVGFPGTAFKGEAGTILPQIAALSALRRYVEGAQYNRALGSSSKVKSYWSPDDVYSPKTK